jgi:hypothetical protein
MQSVKSSACCLLHAGFFLRLFFDPEDGGDMSFETSWLYNPLNLGRFFSFLTLYTVGRTPWMRDQPVAMSLSTHRTTQTQNKHKQTSMPLVGFEPRIPVFKRAETVHALECAATMIGSETSFNFKNTTRWCRRYNSSSKAVPLIN